MITSIRHSAFVVRDIDKSLKFYSNTLGLKIYKRFTEKGEFIDKLTGIDDVLLEWVKLIIPNGGLIELLQYHSHPDPECFKNFAIFPSNKLGSSHVALTVQDLNLLYIKIIDNGFICKSKPLIAPGGKALLLYCHDPDGAIIELIQEL